jgi:cellulose biosynthesis protein BcsQ
VVGQLFKLLAGQLKKAARDYDYIIMDCAPGISALTEVGIRAADMVVVPTIPDSLSTYGLQAFCKSLWTGQLAERTKLRKPPRARVLITRRKTTNEHNKIVAKMRNEPLAQDPSFDLFETEVPETTKIAEAFSKRMSTFHMKWGATNVTVLENLSDEAREALNGA